MIKSNPTVIELISSPKDCVRIKHELMHLFKPADYLSKACNARFAGYAMSQIKKAKGLKKKIHNPVEKTRKTVLDFCYVSKENGSVSAKTYLTENNITQSDCGLVKIANMKDVYGLYHDEGTVYNGIIKSAQSNDVNLSSIPKDKQQKTILYFNKDGYSFYCKSYKAYWKWVDERNEDRFSNTLSHGKNYDAKNMMHTFRLLRMAQEIGSEGKVHVRRSDRDFLLNIKAGGFEYDDLLDKANNLMLEIDQVFEKSHLADTPNSEKLADVLLQIRNHFYQ